MSGSQPALCLCMTVSIPHPLSINPILHPLFTFVSLFSSGQSKTSKMQHFNRKNQNKKSVRNTRTQIQTKKQLIIPLFSSQPNRSTAKSQDDKGKNKASRQRTREYEQTIEAKKDKKKNDKRNQRNRRPPSSQSKSVKRLLPQ